MKTEDFINIFNGLRQFITMPRYNSHGNLGTNYMGACIRAGRFFLHSDSAGLFLYNIPQFLMQCLTFSYAIYVMKKWRTPVLFRWIALLFWTVYPYFPIWGITMVKDTPYYVFVLLFTVVLADVLGMEGQKAVWWQYVLAVTSGVIICLARNDGRYVVAITLIFVLFLRRECWRLCLSVLFTCIVLLFLEEGVYMPLKGIEKGPAREMLSVPLQQMARYFRDHLEDVTEEEIGILQEGFLIDVRELGAHYTPCCSDSVKSYMVEHPEEEYLRAYFKIWFAQLWRHPDTYIQAFLNHIYGYFYLGTHNYGDYLIFSQIGNSSHWVDGHLDMQFAMKKSALREILCHCTKVTEKIPFLSVFLGCGIYTYIMLGVAICLVAHRRWRDILILLPGLSVLLICMFSPVNGFMRYMLPVTVTMPVQVAWCYSRVS